ncbi:PREDICTED: eukaryotic translation initiation factor 3 subunit A-like [Vollenhovia emeryi]|uniref:eukaryotic translation initiation factor 3 subunit A-like n=1 Tax=Vollenhovia emeryi TaxID=411798 RepID=UPI0005F43F86|nr:PREDICTED: eukaryotic translation initiation factor 3 subunit A-like [Vollenhovia emeryi]
MRGGRKDGGVRSSDGERQERKVEEKRRETSWRGEEHGDGGRIRRCNKGIGGDAKEKGGRKIEGGKVKRRMSRQNGAKKKDEEWGGSRADGARDRWEREKRTGGKAQENDEVQKTENPTEHRRGKEGRSEGTAEGGRGVNKRYKRLTSTEKREIDSRERKEIGRRDREIDSAGEGMEGEESARRK